MKSYPLSEIGNLNTIDRNRKYFPRYDEQTFLDQIKYTGASIVDYFPEKLLKEYQMFKKSGQYLKIGFWTVDILFVSFCHKISFINRLLGIRTWKMLLFKIACIAFPLNFLQKIEQDANQQFFRHLYRLTHKFYKRYKQNGDILDLNRNIELEQNQTSLQKICHLNKFRLVHGYKESGSHSISQKVV